MFTILIKLNEFVFQFFDIDLSNIYLGQCLINFKFFFKHKRDMLANWKFLFLPFLNIFKLSNTDVLKTCIEGDTAIFAKLCFTIDN